MSIQAQVINLLEDLQDEFGLAYVFIAHDLSVVRHISDRVAVMYLGKIVEIADRDALYQAPAAPVHAGAAVGGAGARPATPRRSRERILLAGRRAQPDQPAVRLPVPHPVLEGPGPSAPQEVPPLRELAPGHQVACHFPEVRVRHLSSSGAGE